MKPLREVIQSAQKEGKAIGHFNISNLEGLWAIFLLLRSGSQTKTGMPASTSLSKEALIFMSEMSREIKTKRTSKRRLLGLLSLIRYFFQKSNEKFKLKIRKLFQLNIG